MKSEYEILAARKIIRSNKPRQCETNTKKKRPQWLTMNKVLHNTSLHDLIDYTLIPFVPAAHFQQ